MAIITFLSDFGTKDHYVSVVKARIFSEDSSAKILDISHSIPLNNVLEAAFVLKNTYKDFPKGTVHIVAVNESYRGNAMIIELHGQFFISRDSGFFGLLTTEPPSKIVVIPEEKVTSFTTKNLFAKIASQLANGIDINTLGYPVNDYSSLKYPEARVAQNQINGQVMYVDSMGNLITNINRSQFEQTWNKRHFEVSFEREYLREIFDRYTDVDPGDAVCFFNDNDLLEIAVNDGNASKLFGLEYGASVKIYFR